MALGVHHPGYIARDGLAFQPYRRHPGPVGGHMGAPGDAGVLLRGRLHPSPVVRRLHAGDFAPFPQAADGAAARTCGRPGGGVDRHRLGAGGDRRSGLDLAGGDTGAVAPLVPGDLRGAGAHRPAGDQGPLEMGRAGALVVAGAGRNPGCAPLHPGPGLGGVGELPGDMGVGTSARLLLRTVCFRPAPHRMDDVLGRPLRACRPDQHGLLPAFAGGRARRALLQHGAAPPWPSWR